MNQTHFEKNVDEKTLTIRRVIAAPVERVWEALTTSALLEKWWGPKPYNAVTKSFEFKEGGRWIYCMKGPTGNDDSWAFLNYDTIEPGKRFTGNDGFCDEEGNPDRTHFAPMHWDVSVHEVEGGTELLTVITFERIEDMQKVLEMGMQEGYTTAQDQLEAMLA